MTSPAAGIDTASSSPRGAFALLLIGGVSVVVIVACVLASFRLGFAADLSTALLVNGPRVLFGMGVGAALALSGHLRLSARSTGPLQELEILAVSTGAAGGGFLLAGQGAYGVLRFAVGAVAGALLLVGLVRALDRPKRWTNLAAAALIAAMAGIAALVGTYVRERRDVVAPTVSWLLGDLGGTSFASGVTLVGLAAILVIATRRAPESVARWQLALISFGIGTGAAGPLAFVGTFAPRTVRWLARGASEGALLPVSAAAGAATVVAVDAVPRLLLGGYDFPWNLPAAMLAVPIFLGWNRVRLRREAGAASRAFEILEIVVLVGLTLAGVWLASVLTRVIRAAT